MGTSHEHGRQPVMKMKTVTTHYKIPGSATNSVMIKKYNNGVFIHVLHVQ